MDNFSGDFNLDYYKDLLNKDQHREDAVVIGEVDKDGNLIDVSLNENELKNFVQTGLPAGSQLEEMKREYEENKKRNLEESKQISDAFDKMFAELNKKYGLTVKFTYDSFADALVAIADKNAMRAKELYISEGFSRFRVLLYEQYLETIVMLSRQLLNPSYILSESLTWKDKMDIIEKLFNFMTQMEEIYDKVKIDNAQSKLEKITESQQVSMSLDDPRVRDFLERFSAKANKRLE